MPKTIESEIDALNRKTTSELVERYEELHGHASRTRHRAYLIRKIAWRIQALRPLSGHLHSAIVGREGNSTSRVPQLRPSYDNPRVRVLIRRE